MGRRIFPLLVVTVTVFATAIAPARAQGPEVTVDVIAQPIWHTAQDTLDLRLELSNTGAEALSGYIVTV